MEFKYYYGNQADQFSFIRIPRMLLTDAIFAPLSIQAKLLYGVLLDRMGISMRNGWFDEKNRAYIIYQISEIQEDLGFTKRKAIDYLNELEQFGLVEKKRRGRGLPSILYVKSFLTDKKCEMVTSDENTDDLRSAEIDTQEVTESAPQEVPESSLLEVRKSTPLKSNNNINYTDLSNISSNHILSADKADDMGCDGIGSVECTENIRDQIEYDCLLHDRSLDKELLDGIVDIMTEVMLGTGERMLIARSEYPTSFVKERYRRLDSEHIRYVMDCFNSNTTRVGNIKKYLMTALFNAPTTIGSFYTAAVHHDMPYLAAKRIGG